MMTQKDLPVLEKQVVQICERVADDSRQVG